MSLPLATPAPDYKGKKARPAERLRQWRNRIITSPRLRGLMMRVPGLRWLANRKANALFRITAGFIFTKVLTLCVKLGLFEQLRSGARSSADLASACGLPLERMKLVLDQAARLDLITEIEPDVWMLDDAGAVVASDPGIRAMVMHHELFYQDLAEPDRLLSARDPDTHLRRYWAYVRANGINEMSPQTAADYSALMHHSQTMLADCVLAAHDFGQYHALLDVGGGDGSFLALCAQHHPNLKLTLFDLPLVAALAQETFNSLGLGARSTVSGGDFATDKIPDTAECVSLVRILCDHDDGKVRQILANLHRSLKPGTRLVVAEAMAGPSEGARLAAVYFSMYFLAMGSGRCRTDTEIKAFLTEAGFRRPRTVATHTPLLATLVLAER